MVKILWVMICLHPNCKNVAPKHQHRPPVLDKPSATDPHARRADGVELGWQQIRVAVVVMDVGTTLVPTPLWQSGKQSFPSVFPPICLVFISRPPTYKGKLSTISIFRWFIAFGSGTSRGCANLCQGFWVGGGSPLSHQSSTKELLLLSHLSWCDWLCCDWINPNFIVSFSAWLTSSFSLSPPLQAMKRKAGKDWL